MQNKQSIETIKLEREVALIEIEIKNKKIHTTLSIVKALAIALGTIVLFLIIQRPESIINQKASQETISRERAKLLLEVIKDKDPESRRISLKVIKASYPQPENKWIIEIEQYLTEKANQEASQILKMRYKEFLQEKQKLEKAIESEIKSNRPGKGPLYQKMSAKLAVINAKIEETLSALKLMGIMVSENGEFIHSK